MDGCTGGRHLHLHQDQPQLLHRPRAADPAYLATITRARTVMATFADMEELIRLGAYRAGSSPEVDEAIALNKPLEAFLGQGKDEASSLAEGYRRLAQIVGAVELCGMDVVEVSPPYDHAETTAMAGNRAALEAISALAVRKKAGKRVRWEPAP